MKAATVLATASNLVSGDRAQTHGDAKAGFDDIARYWSEYLNVTVSAKDAALMMALLKIARTHRGSRNDDDFIDAAGYIALAAEVSDA